ncbi:MAG: hypothetical protein NZM37_05200, partial [Sandaracinaceae bacterium]|nr:hypothetical protein [Sandaracinaceae bacterium]
QPYIDHPEDRNLLIKLHRSYIALVDEAYEKVMEGGGVAFIPHTYGPYELPISSVGRDIVEQLREAHRPERRNRLPVRPEIDLLTRQADGARIVEDQLVEALREKLEQAGFNVTESAVYRLVPGTQAWKHASRFPGRVLCLEVRRDLLVESYEALAPMRISWEGVLRVARPLADVIGGWLDGRGAISAPRAAA